MENLKKKMYNYFEIQLKEKSESQSSNDLWVQWETAKKYAPSVLSLIVNVFPHFSLHDVSHSETILEIIRKILGDNQIRKLSATDIWMLLFSAYFHDIGMFVSKNDISELINNEEFLAFLKKSQTDKNSDVYPYAILFCIKDNKLYYKKENVTPKGDIFPEIFGFAYSLTSLGKFKGFTAIEPLVLEPLNEETQIEQLPEVLENNIGYIEPIIFDSHISVAIIKKAKINKRGRLNIILDMSRYHVEENLLDNTIFPEEFYFNNYSYPNFSIQKGNSCGLWFYGIIECIYSNVKYKNIDDVCSSIDNYRTDFFIDVINCLSNCLFGIPDIIDNSCIETSLNIKETRIYELGQLSTYSFRKEAIKSYYFSLASLFAYYEGSKVNYDAKLNGIELLLEYQYLIDNIKNFLSLVIFNDNYFKAYSSKEIYEKKQKYEYQILIQKLKKLLSKVNQSYDKEFNKSLYEQFEDYLNHGISDYKEKVTNAYLKLKSTIPQNNNNNIIDINILKKEFDVIKNSKKNVALKEESTIIKYLNPNSEFYFQMLIH